MGIHIDGCRDRGSGVSVEEQEKVMDEEKEGSVFLCEFVMSSAVPREVGWHVRLPCNILRICMQPVTDQMGP
jgi:hypothetical protein